MPSEQYAKNKLLCCLMPSEQYAKNKLLCCLMPSEQYAKNKLLFDEMMMVSVLYKINALGWIFIVLTH
jgi:hypothetical protein